MGKTVYPRDDEIGLRVKSVYRTSFSYFGTTWTFNVRSKSEENIAKSCLTYYKSMWENNDLNAKDVVLDIGAHSGFFTVPISSKVQHVIAYEPSPANFEMLRTNLALNIIGNVTAYRRAISSKDGIETFNLGVYGTTGHMLASVGNKRGGVSVDVQCDQLERVLREKSITVIKLDAEGIEWDLFRYTLDWGHVRLIVAELHKVTDEKMFILNTFLAREGFVATVKHSSWFSKLEAAR